MAPKATVYSVLCRRLPVRPCSTNLHTKVHGSTAVPGVISTRNRQVPYSQSTSMSAKKFAAHRGTTAVLSIPSLSFIAVTPLAVSCRRLGAYSVQKATLLHTGIYRRRFPNIEIWVTEFRFKIQRPDWPQRANGSHGRTQLAGRGEKRSARHIRS
ncbi:Uncharacterised protein [Anaerotruncus sp. 2789STDY5834896]|uniref:Uncharacterized protein n=1 Tax=uncultured Anaerotruncus sp. TaxID=905011 RepID=A0A1C6GLY4_9FIRM|nr:Uncharacterised protein [uncultured Anaerotruncus sp.]